MRAFRLRLALVNLAVFFEDMAVGKPRLVVWFALPGALASFACALHYFTTPFEIDKYGRAMTHLEMLAFGTITAMMGLVLAGVAMVKPTSKNAGPQRPGATGADRGLFRPQPVTFSPLCTGYEGTIIPLHRSTQTYRIAPYAVCTTYDRRDVLRSLDWLPTL